MIPMVELTAIHNSPTDNVVTIRLKYAATSGSTKKNLLL